MRDNEYALMIVAPDYTFRHLRDEGAVYGFRSGFGFVDKLDVRRFGWTVQRMDAVCAHCGQSASDCTRPLPEETATGIGG